MQQQRDDEYTLNIRKLYKYKDEHEERHCCYENGQVYTTFAYTDRAIMARHKILLQNLIGKGSYSKVHVAYHFEKLHYLAVKIIDRRKIPSDFHDKFLPRELDVWSRLKHKNIIKMYYYFLTTEKIYMLLQIAEKGDMLTYVQQLGGPVHDWDCKLWMSQICDAVKYLHGHSIIHRDLKLENLLLDTLNNIKLCDFGFAKDVSKTQIFNLSETYCGSKAYASPEILNGEPYDPMKADIWAIGVILFIFLTGNMPFKEDTVNYGMLEQQKSLKIFCCKYQHLTGITKKLLKWIFTYDWLERPNITDLLRDEYFTTKCQQQPYCNKFNQRKQKQKSNNSDTTSCVCLKTS